MGTHTISLFCAGGCFSWAEERPPDGEPPANRPLLFSPKQEKTALHIQVYLSGSPLQVILLYHVSRMLGIWTLLFTSWREGSVAWRHWCFGALGYVVWSSARLDRVFFAGRHLVWDIVWCRGVACNPIFQKHCAIFCLATTSERILIGHLGEDGIKFAVSAVHLRTDVF